MTLDMYQVLGVRDAMPPVFADVRPFPGPVVVVSGAGL